MTRLIVLTFAFLGWAFYEMSGGADFEPRGVRAPEPERVATARPAEPKSLVFPINAEELVTKAALGQVKTVQAPQDTEITLSAEESRALLSQASFGVNANGSLFQTQDAPITLASLQEGATGMRQDVAPSEPEIVQPAEPAEPSRDIREITGARVNMRSGPGTIYPVISRLTIGHQVEVLDDSGTGWLRLRVLPEQHMGWISTSLISKKSN